ncbi:MAG: hypothetical protein H6901_01105 [Rhodobacteraceae bacterium]|nr:hypothetical protein [Paracoccaceae bacterium]MCP5340801.1 hypothetical protein [Paracoccaceae bacterium]
MRIAHLLRMARWAHRPPSTRRVILVFSVVAICLVLAGAEWLDLLPEGFGRPPDRQIPKIRALP